MLKFIYTIIPEVDSGKRFADVIFLLYYPKKPAMIIEFKYEKIATTGLIK